MTCPTGLSNFPSLMDPIKDSSGSITISSIEPEPDQVKIPDLFLSFSARSPRINAHYARVKSESESWIRECVVMRNPKKIRDDCS